GLPGRWAIRITRGAKGPAQRSGILGVGKRRQFAPRSSERYTLMGEAPAYMRSAFVSAAKKLQTCTFLSGKPVRWNVAPRSELRYTPSGVPAKTRSGSAECTKTAKAS